MASSYNAFVDSLSRLLQRFEAGKAHYLSKGYLEAQARLDFITPFFEGLGWDVRNEAGLPHHEREVIVESGAEQGRPDYSFRLGGQTKFFVESKSPSESLEETRHILQAKGYAWNTREVFFVILTDFEEFRFYDATFRPDERKPDEGLLLQLKHTEYLKVAEKLWEFSKERVAAGSLDAFLPRGRVAQGYRIPVDKAFLEEMTEWRSELARNVYKNNPDLSTKQLNEVVQRLLDRIVFIRIAEDRRIIEKNLLRDAVDEWKARGGKLHIRQWLTNLFLRINEDFNGEIFKPHLCEQVRYDSEVLTKIVERLNPPKSPYQFDVIGVELLGSIYERYLGKTIRVTPKQVRVEEKPEVRKAGGVYYTPKYIVDYIVQNSVGKIIAGKSPKQIERIRILDPACGSGSFLIGAFQYLIDYHVRYLQAHPKEAHVHPLYPDLVPDGNGGHRLSVRLKAKILRNNLFGVDIDPQAVEITMMSLYLKALEGERSLLPPKQSLLPELKYNILCGNSLIGPDIFNKGNFFDDGEEERERIQPLDWNAEMVGFGQIMKAGGFDCVIGNPPYGALFGDPEEKYFRLRYPTSSPQIDSYALFMEKAVELCKPNGMISMIAPTGWYSGTRFGKLRQFIACKTDPEIFVNLPYDIFPGWVDTTVFVLQKRSAPLPWPRRAGCRVVLKTFPKRHKIESVDEFNKGIEKAEITRWFAGGADEFLTYAGTAATALIRKIRASGKPLNDFADVQRGITPFHLTDKPIHKNSTRAFDGVVRRYSIEQGPRKFVRFDSSLSEPKPARYFKGPRLLLRELISRQFRLQAVKTEHDFVTNKSMQSILPKLDGPDLNYLLGILNSRLMSWYFLSKSNIAQRDDFPKIVLKETRSLPVPPLNLSNALQRSKHDRIVRLVTRMLQVQERKRSPKLAPSQLDRLEREFAWTDGQIDELVYRLYGITKEERKIIEEA